MFPALGDGSIPTTMLKISIQHSLRVIEGPLADDRYRFSYNEIVDEDESTVQMDLQRY
jgi:hypothetical protein